MEAKAQSGKFVKIDASTVLDEVMSGLAKSLMGDDAAIKGYFNHPAAVASEQSAEFHNMLVDMKKLGGVSTDLVGRIQMALQFALVSGFTLAQTIEGM